MEQSEYHIRPDITKIKHTTKKQCTCVPSGVCHSHMLLGCPHKHYFDNKGVWTCVMK